MQKLQVLVATMGQKDFSKIEEMNIASDVIFANQSEDTKYDEKEFEGHLAKMITTATRGVGCNRNIALEYADGDILLIADDDVKYISGYSDVILKAFGEVPQADALIFNIRTVGKFVERRKNKQIKRVHYLNALNYGAVRIAVKRKKLIAKNIKFTTCFGGGTLYSAGEDSMFIWDMLKKGMKIYTYPVVIAEVDQTTSSWFQGYNSKYFYDKGALYCALTNNWIARFLCIQDLLRHQNLFKESGMAFGQIIEQMNKGIKGYKTLLPYKDNERDAEKNMSGWGNLHRQ